MMPDVPVAVSDVVPVPVIVRRLARIRCVDRPGAEQAIDTADDTANNAADHAANRSGGLGPHRRPMSSAIGDALGMSSDRGRE